MNRRDLLVTAFAAGGLGYSPLEALADSYSPRTVTITVGFAAGGAGDLATRVIADHVRLTHKIPVGRDFRPGAGGTLAADQLARAKPDGTTLSLYSASPIIVAPHLQKVPYDPLKDFTYIGSYVAIAIPFFVRSDSRLQGWDNVLEYARANPSGLRWATAAPRGVAHIATEAAFAREGVRTTFVPFSGGAEAITALLGGHIHAVVSSDYGPHLDSGSVRLLIETGPDSIPGLPDVPTFKSRGYPISIPASYGLIGPAGLPNSVIEWWQNSIRELSQTEVYQTFLRTIRGTATLQDPATFTRTVHDGYRAVGVQLAAMGLKT
ncbi:tripartite tricarboxylate transporter substrate binding protein (plasmid) [Bosea vestrisii]|uniref:Bug family tripartite tricarboxylate transporter substrate binding protein n=1 Tax=Bosea vestrisii TaxID=151416 RepID=UPI0024DFDDEC|nr:tripartite tricarboxylate transporter substrate binding protein [Bosea vestrisii]WID99741.1 tripartite tricarboxylate transporter substrate binding protein [Bosea vestrisii]